MASDIREVRDPRVLRAVAHPFRLTLLELVERRGTLTSAEASALTGESTASCSFHLRQLAKYGFLEAAPATNRRERPWRRAVQGERVPSSSDPELNRAGAEVTKLHLDRLAGAAGRWLERQGELPAEWQDAALVDDELLYLTAAEARALSRRLVALFERYRSRTADPASRPARARAVRAAALLFPLDDADGLP